MSADISDVEQLLRSALAPVDPPDRLVDRLESRLSEITDLAVEELADWELATMRDPRNWVPTVVAAGVGTAAAGALVVVRARQRNRKKQTPGLTALEQSLREVADDLGKRLG